MDSGILSVQSEKLPASGLMLELKCPLFGERHFGFSYFLSVIYFLFFLLLLYSVYSLPLLPFFPSLVVQFLCIAMLLVWYFQYLFRKHFLLTHPFSINKIVFTELGWCYVQLNNSRTFKADIESDTILSEHLVILVLKGRKLKGWRRKMYFNNFSVLLTADRLNNDKFREIKRHLRFISFTKIPDKKET